jgi:hypothetical protein
LTTATAGGRGVTEGDGDLEIDADGEGEREVEGVTEGEREVEGLTLGEGVALGAGATTNPNSEPVALAEVSTSLAYEQRRGRVLLFPKMLYPDPADTTRKVSVALVATTSWPAGSMRQNRLVSTPLANIRNANPLPLATARTAKVTG